MSATRRSSSLTLPTIFDLPHELEDSVAAALGEGETLTLDYLVAVADAVGESDEAVLSFTLDDEGLLV
ncbi:MAG: hypothetical protein MnENMB40S_14630 [Rhizobiaceae bacterium MnEN-MB40S]|nr:MAG: hypothetical protein MnENMB40S_14630 [Rhizobiaceae bacterium MnEN-MB40S]